MKALGLQTLGLHCFTLICYWCELRVTLIFIGAAQHQSTTTLHALR